MGQTSTLQAISEFCLQHQFTVATAESCTAGLLAATLTSLPGSSDWFEGGFVTYRLSAKEHLLGISPAALDEYGAVSRETAEQMVKATQTKTGADIAVATTGLAGPEGDGSSATVGTLWVAWSWPEHKDSRQLETEQIEILDTRERFRERAVDFALRGLKTRLVR